MIKGSSQNQENRPLSSQFNARLPLLTHDQITLLADSYGLTKTQVIILAVDRLVRDLDSESPDAEKDLSRLKTVARIVPEIDLGQDE